MLIYKKKLSILIYVTFKLILHIKITDIASDDIRKRGDVLQETEFRQTTDGKGKDLERKNETLKRPCKGIEV
jgi:hypothetical protein